jgi:hypothetical protein
MKLRQILWLSAAAALTAGVFGSSNLFSSVVHTLLDGAGTFFSWFIVAFLYGWFFHSGFVQEIEPFIRKEQMPRLRPVPIPTKDRNVFVKPLVWLFEHRRWTLEEDWCFEFVESGQTVKIVLNKGFDFDGASIPRVFWTLVSPVGLLLIPGLVHDYGYKYDQLWELRNDKIRPYRAQGGKACWDDMFWRVGQQVNGFGLLNLLAWFAVFAGGWGAWNHHRKNERNPEEARPETAGRSSDECQTGYTAVGPTNCSFENSGPTDGRERKG